MPGVVTLQSRLPQIQATLAARVEIAVESGKHMLAQEISSAAPVGASGQLRDSVQAARDGIYVAFTYIFSEFGTVHQAPQPWMIPALEENKDAVLAEVETMLRRL